MKQHISIDQLNELSDKGRDAFEKYVLSKKLPYAATDKNILQPLLSIGQMIEFLDEHGEFIGGHVSGDESQIWKDDRGWALAHLRSDILMGYLRESSDQHKELCDALWMATKNVLETDNNGYEKLMNETSLPVGISHNTLEKS